MSLPTPASAAPQPARRVNGESKIALTDLRADGGTQPRDQISDEWVAKYVEALGRGDILPAVVVFYDGTDYWLADGFHRLAAHRSLGLAEIECDVRQGTRRDAILFSVRANATHGYPRSNADKRRAVMVLLGDPEWSEWSDREISRRCAVNHHLVTQLRPAPAALTESSPSERAPTYTTKHGTTAKMNTTKIGRSPKSRRTASVARTPFKKGWAAEGSPVESQHDRDLEFLQGAWDAACLSARAAFLRRLGYEPLSGEAA